MKKKIILLLLSPIYLISSDKPGGFALNFTVGFKTSIIQLVEALQGPLFLAGLILLAYTGYSIFLDDNPQKRGVGNLFIDIFLFFVSFILILSKQSVMFLLG